MVISIQTSYAQKTEYSSLLIPDSLKTNANAIVRERFLEITIKSSSKLVIKERRAVTVLNKSGDKHADSFERYNNDTKINKLSIKVYDALGKEIKIFGKQIYRCKRCKQWYAVFRCYD